MKQNPPKNNYLRYYFGIKLSNGSTLCTTSMTELSSFIDVSRITLTRAFSKAKYKSTSSYIVAVTDQIVRQNKGNRRTFRNNTDKYKQYVEGAIESYKKDKEAAMQQYPNH